MNEYAGTSVCPTDGHLIDYRRSLGYVRLHVPRFAVSSPSPIYLLKKKKSSAMLTSVRMCFMLFIVSHKERWGTVTFLLILFAASLRGRCVCVSSTGVMGVLLWVGPTHGEEGNSSRRPRGPGVCGLLSSGSAPASVSAPLSSLPSPRPQLCVRVCRLPVNGRTASPRVPHPPPPEAS